MIQTEVKSFAIGPPHSKTCGGCSALDWQRAPERARCRPARERLRASASTRAAAPESVCGRQRPASIQPQPKLRKAKSVSMEKNVVVSVIGSCGRKAYCLFYKDENHMSPRKKVFLFVRKSGMIILSNNVEYLRGSYTCFSQKASDRRDLFILDDGSYAVFR